MTTKMPERVAVNVGRGPEVMPMYKVQGANKGR